MTIKDLEIEIDNSGSVVVVVKRGWVGGLSNLTAVVVVKRGWVVKKNFLGAVVVEGVGGSKNRQNRSGGSGKKDIGQCLGGGGLSK